MSHAEKSLLYQELKNAGVKFDKQYRQYTTAELQAAVNLLRQRTGQPTVEQERAAALVAPVVEQEPQYPSFVDPSFTAGDEHPGLTPQHAVPVFHDQLPAQPVATQRAPDTDAGIRQNAPATRVDENGLTWYQDEIRKPAYPKPRARRVLRYSNPGSVTQTVVNGNMTETFEVAGTGHTAGEIKITLPSYQVGIYSDPRFPFKIHIYNEIRGFDLFEVQEFYGGAELVPEEIKRMYVENVLCYDIRTVIRAIETEARQLDLKNGLAR